MELILSAVLLTSILVSGVYLLLSSPWSRDLPASLQWAGRRDEMFSATRACLRELKAGDSTLIEGYSKYGRKAQAFIIPDPSLKPQVMLPPEYLKWMLEQPDSVLNPRAADSEKLAFRYISPLMTHPEHVMKDVIRKDLTRNLGKLHAEIFEELRQSVDDTLGTRDSWTEINLFHAMEMIVIRSSSRILVGLPLCHNEKYQSAMRTMALLFGASSVIIGYMPWFVRPVLGFLLSLPVRIYKARALKFILPLITESMESLKRESVDPTYPCRSPNNFIRWMVTAALNSKSTTMTSPEAIAERFLFIILALDSTVVVAANTFLDLLGSAPELCFYEALREEAAAVFQKESDWENPAVLARLTRIDSALRESLRRNPQAVRSRQREIVHRDGLTLPDGHHLPRGSWVGFPVAGVHFDERFYPDPVTYDPFRFISSITEPKPGSTFTDIGSRPQKYLSMGVTSNTFLSFGHGHHSCPGRFFASHVLKMMLAYITLNYDIHPLETRLPNILYGDKSVPPLDTKIRVRRRLKDEEALTVMSSGRMLS